MMLSFHKRRKAPFRTDLDIIIGGTLLAVLFIFGLACYTL